MAYAPTTHDQHDHQHPTELHAAICEQVGERTHRQAAFAYRVSNTTLSGWLNNGNPIGLTPEVQQRLVKILGVSPLEVLRMHGGFDLSDTAAEQADNVRTEMGPYATVVDMAAHRVAQTAEDQSGGTDGRRPNGAA